MWAFRQNGVRNVCKVRASEANDGTACLASGPASVPLSFLNFGYAEKVSRLLAASRSATGTVLAI